MSTRSPTPARRILEALYPRIERVIENTGQQRYGTSLCVERTDDSSATSSEISARIEGSSAPGLSIHLAAHSIEERRYELRLKVGESRTRSFTYCPPDGSRSACGQIQLERKVLSFILDEVGRQIGSE